MSLEEICNFETGSFMNIMELYADACFETLSLFDEAAAIEIIDAALLYHLEENKFYRDATIKGWNELKK